MRASEPRAPRSEGGGAAAEGTTPRSRPDVVAAPTRDAHRAALTASWRALWSSRLLIWIAGIYGVLQIGYIPGFVPSRAQTPFSNLGNLLVAPASGWDAGWYLSIADHGYRSAAQPAFFPLYPLTIKALGFVVRSQLVAGILVSIAALAVALYLLHRLTELELGANFAPAAVLALAFSPMAFFFSAVYTEALLLALSIGALYAGRRGRWAWAGILAAFASATRNSGVLVALPLLLLYLYGPRADRPQPMAAIGRLARLRPRFAPRADSGWLLLSPLGLVAFFAYLALAHHDALASIHATQHYWHRSFQPLRGVVDGATAAWHGLERIAAGPNSTPILAHHSHLLVPPNRLAAYNIINFGFLVAATLATIGVLRRLPVAYGAFCIAGLVLATSAPVVNQPLASLPRYVAVLFPLQMWLALWATERRRLALWIGISALGLGIFTTEFATWRWVA